MSIGARRIFRAASLEIPDLFLRKTFNSTGGEQTGYEVTKATDGLTTTRWTSNPIDNTAFSVDMNVPYEYSKIVITWAGNTTRNYLVQISSDNATWTTISTGITKNQSFETSTITSFSALPIGRYFRVVCIDRWNTSFGNSIWEIEGYGKPAGAQAGAIASFTSTLASSSRVDLKWQYSGAALSKYTITRNGQALTTITNAATTTYSDTTVQANTKYTYTITGTYTAGGVTTTKSTETFVYDATSNILLNKLFTSTAIDEDGYPIANLTDGSLDTRWISKPVDNTVLTVDIGATYTLSSVKITWVGDTTKNYRFEMSSDNNNWTSVYTGATTNTHLEAITVTNFSAQPSARYLRIICIDRWVSGYGNSIWEVEAYGMPAQSTPTTTAPQNFTATPATTSAQLSWTAPAQTNGALEGYNVYIDGVKRNTTLITGTTYTVNGLASASSYTLSVRAVANNQEGPAASVSVTTLSDGAPTVNLFSGRLFVSSAGEVGGYPTSYLTDGKSTTRWISEAADNTTVHVDIGGFYTLDRIVISWAADTVKNYRLEVSNDSQTWKPIYTGVTANTPNEKTTITSFSAAAYGRYFRIVCIDRWVSGYGNSIWEIEGYGTKDPNAQSGTISKFTPSVNTSNQVVLTWEYAGDPVSTYTITRNGTVLTTTAARTYTDTSVVMGSTYTYTVTGTFTTGGKTTNTASGVVTIIDPSKARNAFLLPFSSTSPWALPVVNNTATYDVPVLRAYTPWVNYQEWSHGVWRSTTSDPLVTCVDIGDGHGNYTEQWRIPASAKPAVGTDGHMHIVAPDGHNILELFAAHWVSSTRIECYRMLRGDLLSDGLGPMRGVRAYGGSAIGGLIRNWEINPSDPNYTGRIDHALAIALDHGGQMGKNVPAWTDGWGYYTDGSKTEGTHQPGWNAGQVRNGFMKQSGYVWPATEQDYASMSSGHYDGPIPMGAYFVIPASVDITKLGLSAQALMVARAAQDFGAYVVDSVWGATVFYAEFRNAPTAEMDAFLNGFFANDGVKKVIAELRRVSNNNENNPNGGPLNASRRRPLLPPVA